MCLYVELLPRVQNTSTKLLGSITAAGVRFQNGDNEADTAATPSGWVRPGLAQVTVLISRIETHLLPRGGTDLIVLVAFVELPDILPVLHSFPANSFYSSVASVECVVQSFPRSCNTEHSSSGSQKFAVIGYERAGVENL